MHPKLFVILACLVMNAIGAILYTVYMFITTSDDAATDPSDAWLYVLAIFMFASIMGLQCLCQVLVGDLLSKRKKDIKLARCFGAYVLIFGWGLASNVVLY
jgi:hypothetical protein